MDLYKICACVFLFTTFGAVFGTYFGIKLGTNAMIQCTIKMRQIEKLTDEEFAEMIKRHKK